VAKPRNSSSLVARGARKISTPCEASQGAPHGTVPRRCSRKLAANRAGPDEPTVKVTRVASQDDARNEALERASQIVTPPKPLDSKQGSAERRGSARSRSGAIVRWKTFPTDTCLPIFTKAGGGGGLGGSTDDSPCEGARRGASFGLRRNVRRVGLGSRVGKTTPARTLERRMPDDRNHRSSRSRSAWGAVKRAIHLHVAFGPRVSTCEGMPNAKSRRRKTPFLLQIAIRSKSSTRVDRLGARFDGIGGRRRSHAPLVVWLGSRKRFGRRWDDEARGRIRAELANVRGLVAKRPSNVFDARRRNPKGRDEWVRRVPMFVVSQPRSGIHDGALRCCVVRYGGRRLGGDVACSNPVCDALAWCPR
jgi:hypothetical protein